MEDTYPLLAIHPEDNICGFVFRINSFNSLLFGLPLDTFTKILKPAEHFLREKFSLLFR